MKRESQALIVVTGKALALSVDAELNAARLRDALAAAKELYNLMPTDDIIRDKYIFLLKKVMANADV